jgi:hypothetical protein
MNVKTALILSFAFGQCAAHQGALTGHIDSYTPRFVITSFLFAETMPNFVLINTSFGPFVSHDGAASWHQVEAENEELRGIRPLAVIRGERPQLVGKAYEQRTDKEVLIVGSIEGREWQIHGIDHDGLHAIAVSERAVIYGFEDGLVVEDKFMGGISRFVPLPKRRFRFFDYKIVASRYHPDRAYVHVDNWLFVFDIRSARLAEVSTRASVRDVTLLSSMSAETLLIATDNGLIGGLSVEKLRDIGMTGSVVWHVAASAESSNVFLILDDGVFVAESSLKSWRKTVECGADTKMSVDRGPRFGAAIHGDAVFLGFQGGILRTNTGGKAWQPVNQGLEFVILTGKLKGGRIHTDPQ